jgi:LmbE family N-acetylglucosaminyl deacetylase
VLVTCTDGALGFGPGMAPPGEKGHDEDAVARVRVEELGLAAARLGVSHVEMLGYRDSGMSGWSQNERTTAFCNQPVESVAARLVGLFERYRPQVVVTYYRTTGYNHPDHLQAHDVTVRAVEQSQIPEKLYLVARSRAGQQRLRDVMAARGIETPARPRPADARPPDDGPGPRAAGAGVDDELFTTFVDVVPYLGARRAALEAHASQLQESYFLRAPDDVWTDIYGRETFIRSRDTTGAPVPESDLFAGLR